ncbi:MAG: hypothetical protein OXC55_08830 [Chloroflexi bacterium]|nr:hypothetical protein [Chloroflexota bacterium]
MIHEASTDHPGGQALERLPGLGEDLGHPSPELLHGVAAEDGLVPTEGDHQSRQRVERDMTQIRGAPLISDGQRARLGAQKHARRNGLTPCLSG